MSRQRAVQELIAQVQQMNAVAMQMNKAAAQRVGINNLDLQAVQLLRTSGSPLTASDLARVLGVSTAAATGLVDRLEEAGLVRRAPDAHDRRRTTIELVRDRVAEELGPAFVPLLQRWSRGLSGYTEPQLLLVAEVLAAMTADIDHEVGELRKGERAPMPPAPAGP